MLISAAIGILLPFIGTALGSSAVFIMKKNRRAAFTDCLSGFAGGVMLAASLWSLILPAIERSSHLGALSFLPSAAGLFSGVAFMIFCEKLLQKICLTDMGKGAKRSFLTAFAVTIHNIPEGMAVGLAYVAALSEAGKSSLAGAFSLSLGIAIQNIPEGAIVSLPLFTGSTSRVKAFFYGVLSGFAEILAAAVSIAFVWLFSPLLPYLLSFAAGTMIYVVMNELSEEPDNNTGKTRGMLFFALGFIVMMSLDVSLG